MKNRPDRLMISVKSWEEIKKWADLEVEGTIIVVQNQPPMITGRLMSGAFSGMAY